MRGLKKYDEAIKFCEAALKIYPDDPDLISNIGSNLLLIAIGYVLYLQNKYEES